MAEIVPIETNMPHKMSEVICLKCLCRWMAIRPAHVLLKEIQCTCGHIGFVIETGEELIEDYYGD